MNTCIKYLLMYIFPAAGMYVSQKVNVHIYGYLFYQLWFQVSNENVDIWLKSFLIILREGGNMGGRRLNSRLCVWFNPNLSHLKWFRSCSLFLGYSFRWGVNGKWACSLCTLSGVGTSAFPQLAFSLFLLGQYSCIFSEVTEFAHCVVETYVTQKAVLSLTACSI